MENGVNDLIPLPKERVMVFIISFFFFSRKKEEEKKREVLNNPVKMKKIKELVSRVSNKHYEDLVAT